MIEKGTVLSLKQDGKALIEIKRKPACQSCKACSLKNGQEVSIEAENIIGARVGDKVKLRIETKGLVLGITMTYLLPALGLIIGILLGNFIGLESLSVVPGIIFMLLLFMAAKWHGKTSIQSQAEVLEKVE